MKNNILYLLLLTGLLACKPNTAPKEEVALPTSMPEGFSDFYQRFLTDSLYQMEHILFPLQGLPDRADSSTLASKKYQWQQESWRMHHPIESASGFSINIKPVTDTYVLEDIRHESGRYGMERRYAYMDDGWYLIYYAGLNPLNVE